MSTQIKKDNDNNVEEQKVEEDKVEEDKVEEIKIHDEDYDTVLKQDFYEEEELSEELNKVQEITEEKIEQGKQAILQRYGPSSVVEEFLNDVEENENEVLLSETSVSSSVLSEQGSFIKKVPKFFLNIEEFPRLSQISLFDQRRSTKTSVKTKRSTARSTENLIGSFVDPLTGEIQLSEETISEEEEEVVEEEEVNLRCDYSEDSDLLILYEKDKEEEEIEALLHQEELLEQKDVMELFLEATATKVVIVEPEIDFEALERERNLMLMKKNIKDYLEGLIMRIVEACEYVDIQAIMRENLNKKKLLTELMKKISDFKFEQKVHNFLNRKVVDFFRKKKSQRVFCEDDAETVIQEINKYNSNVEWVDALLGEEKTHKTHIANQIESLTICLDELRRSYREEVYNFETLIKNIFIREKTSDRFKAVIAKYLRVMNMKRDEIEEARLVIRNKQHTFAILHKKLEAVDKLGDGLEIGDYERLGTKIYELDKKIEEQNNNLNKMRLRCHANLHMLTHMKEKANMMRVGLEYQEQVLQALHEKKAQVREALWLLKIEHETIRKKIYEYSFLGGLVNKPDLMLDFDETLSRLTVLHARVDKSKRKLDDISSKIEFLRQNECQF